MKLGAIMAAAPVIPVVVIERLQDAVPLAQALVQGGLKAIEVTLRTPVGVAAIEAIAKTVPEAIVGAGTVLTRDQLAAVVGAGARFVVSPGATPAMLDAAERMADAQLLPGIATASEAMLLIERGYTHAKFFPAEPAGGAAYLAAIHGPLPQLTFCPTGGITGASAPKYLALPNVACVGGSWMAGQAAIRARDWDGIARAASEAASLKAAPAKA